MLVPSYILSHVLWGGIESSAAALRYSARDQASWGGGGWELVNKARVFVPFYHIECIEVINVCLFGIASFSWPGLHVLWGIALHINTLSYWHEWTVLSCMCTALYFRICKQIRSVYRPTNRLTSYLIMKIVDNLFYNGLWSTSVGCFSPT